MLNLFGKAKKNPYKVREQ